MRTPGVEAAVHVVLRVGDVVVELAGDRVPHRVDNAQRRVTLADVLHNDAKTVDIVDLFEANALAFHLAEDRIDMFGPPVDFRHHTRLGQRPLQFSLGAHDQFVAVGLLLLDGIFDLFVRRRVQVAEAQIFQF
jgi:hypothetical protein